MKALPARMVKSISGIALSEALRDVLGGPVIGLVVVLKLVDPVDEDQDVLAILLGEDPK